MPRVNVKDKRKHQLMEANIASIARRGLEDTTIAHVSKGAEMSRGIVNFYFTSKEKMMQETLAFMAAEYTASWQEALENKLKETKDPITLIEAILRALLSDRLCSHKRLAVWAAFIGHAGTHPAHAKIIHNADESLVKQLKELWQKVLPDAKVAEQRARQMQALIRGHHLSSALGADINRPSTYFEAWAHLFEATSGKQEKVTKIKPDASAKQGKKPHPPSVLPGQLDFGDLFSSN